MTHRNTGFGGGMVPLILSALLLMASSAFGQSQNPCDPEMAADKNVIALRDSHKIASALKAARATLQAHPDNFRTNYLLADVLIANGSERDGLAQLLITEKMLGLQKPYCIRHFGWYSIYNTIGVQYYRSGRDDKALAYFLKGYEHLNDSISSTKIMVLNNIGLMYFKKFDLDNSLKYYTLAKENHSSEAQSHIDMITKLQKSAR